MSSAQNEFPLSKKKIIKKTLVASIVWTILLLIITVILIAINLSNTSSEISSIITLTFIGTIILLIVIVIISYLYQRWYFNTYFYDFSADYVVIKKGPITPKEITIPYERIQDVYVDQDLLDRIFGLYDVHLSSATITSGMEAHIDGVEKPASDGLRATLLKVVSARISKKGIV